MYGAMDRNGSFDFGEAFARLMEVLDGATSLACEGQAANHGTEQHSAPVVGLECLTCAAG